MTFTVFLAVMAAALMHAVWNAMVKVHFDRFASVTLMTLGTAVTALPAVPFVDFPQPHVWPWILASVAFHYEQTAQAVTYRVVMLAELAGDFVVPPAFVELMYQTEVRGHSGTFALRVTE